MPHKNAELLETFYKSLQDKDHQKIANCYHQDAAFTDIAFDIKGKKHIHAMWHMICETNLKLSHVNVENANERTGSASWEADYTFNDNGTEREVHNKLKSSFEFKDGLIIKQTDDCNVREWAMQALGPVKGLAAWLLPGLRHRTAKEKLRSFIDRHPVYAPPPP
jgi:ketosteroid isomerase-like protein